MKGMIMTSNTVMDMVQKFLDENPFEETTISDEDYCALYSKVCNNFSTIIDPLSDREFNCLFGWLINFVATESIKAEKAKVNTSENITILDGIATYMRDQFMNGKREYLLSE